MSDYHPSRRQAHFRALVQEVLDADLSCTDITEKGDDGEERLVARLEPTRQRLTLSAWCRAWRQKYPRARAVNAREFVGWESSEGFLEWWEDGLPDFSDVTDSEWRFAYRQLFDQMVRGMPNPKTQAVFASVHERKDGGGGQLSEELRTWMTSGNAAAWGHGGPVAEAK